MLGEYVEKDQQAKISLVFEDIKSGVVKYNKSELKLDYDKAMFRFSNGTYGFQLNSTSLEFH